MKVQRKDDGFETLPAPDRACEPFIPEAATLTCSRRVKPQSGDFVVFVPKDGSAALLRQYVVQKDGTILLHAPNKSFDSYVSGLAELEEAGELLPALRFERDFPAAARAGLLSSLPPQTADAPRTDSDLLTFEEAQAALKVRRTKMYAMLRGGELRASKVGKLWRIERSSIAEYLSHKTFRKK